MEMIDLTRGDTGAFKFQRKDKNGNVIGTVPAALYFTVKKSFSTSEVVLQKTVSDMTLDESFYWHFRLEPEDTEELEVGCYAFDIEVTDADPGGGENYVQTIVKGRLNLTAEATWSDNK